MKIFLTTLVLMFFFAHSPGIQETSFAQIPTQKVSPVKPAEQPKQFQTQPKPQFQVSPSIRVVYPNGGETWEKGKTYTIRWTSHNVQGNVSIALEWDPPPYDRPTPSRPTLKVAPTRIAVNVPNTGSYAYTLKDVPRQGNKFIIEVSSVDGAVRDRSDNFFTITHGEGVIPLRPPVFRFINPKGFDNVYTKETLVRGQPYTIRWQGGEKDADLRNIKILLENRQSKQTFWVTQSTKNMNSYSYTIPLNVPDGIYVFLIMPLNEEFINQSPEFYIGPNNNVDLVVELRNVATVWTYKWYFIGASTADYIEFEIWVMNRGAQYLRMVPILWRIVNDPDNSVILQHTSGFSDVYPNRYYKTKLKYSYDDATACFFWTSHKGWGPGPFRIEAEVDPQRTLGEMEISRGDNKAQKRVFYDMHIKGRKEY